MVKELTALSLMASCATIGTGSRYYLHFLIIAYTLKSSRQSSERNTPGAARARHGGQVRELHGERRNLRETAQVAPRGRLCCVGLRAGQHTGLL